jgi:hypothetical protein
MTRNKKLAVAQATTAAVLFFVLAAGGCATAKNGQDAPRPGQGIVEYQELVTEAQHTVGRALNALDRTSQAAPCCSHRDIEALSDEVQHLQVDSLRIRARVQVIQERGDAWFQNWHQHVTQISDPRIRALANEHRPELEQHFVAIKENSIQTRAAFGPFFNGLREIRTALEKDPAAIQFGPMQDHVRTTRARGQEVQERLAATSRELRSMQALITPGKTTISR